MAVQSPEQLIAAGPSTTPDQPSSGVPDSDIPALAKQAPDVPELPEYEPRDDVKLKSDQPTKLKTDQIKDDGSTDDPVKKLSDFLKPKEVKKEEKKEEKKDEPKELEKKEEEDDTPPTAKPIKPREPLEEQLKKIDMSLFSQDEQGLLRKMDRSAREWVVARTKELKELREKVKTAGNRFDTPAQWHDHPEAYILNPEFRDALEATNRLDSEKNFWYQQLVAIEAGEKWQRPYLDKDGSIKYVESAADTQSKVFVQQKMNQAMQLMDQQRGIAEGIKNSFESTRGTLLQSAKAIEDKFFPQYATEEGAKELSENKLVKNVDQFLSSMGQQNNVLSGFLKKLYLWGLGIYEQNRELENKTESKVALEKERVKAGPTNDELLGGKTKDVSGDNKPFDFNEFNKYRG